MEVIERKPIPIYETTCRECKSVIRYKRSEMNLDNFITCPVCGVSSWATYLKPVSLEDSE